MDIDKSHTQAGRRQPTNKSVWGEWLMRSLLMITTSWRQKDVLRRYVPTVGLIHCSLFPEQLSQICCQSCWRLEKIKKLEVSIGEIACAAVTLARHLYNDQSQLNTVQQRPIIT